MKTVLAIASVTLALGAEAQAPRRGGYGALVELFGEWRAFQKPRLVDGVPDYSAAAMEAQRRKLPELRRRLDAIDASGWPIAQQIDVRLVRAEMNGLDFDHRVLRPWARDPCFYTVVFGSESDVPAREGPVHEGAIELWRYRPPLAAPELAALRARLQAVPAILQQARANLGGDARDLWLLAVRVNRDESALLAEFAKAAAPHHPELVADVERARGAVDAFRAWLEQQLPSKRGASGVGVENYDWYLKNVHLVPYTWRDEVALFGREHARALAALALEQNRNRRLPPLQPIATAEEWQRRFQAAVTEFMGFLRDTQVMTIEPYMDGALRVRGGGFAPPEARDVFAQVDFRDPLVMRCHGSHWFDRARGERQPHASPIRRVPLLYNIWDSRAEGLATAMEEMMLTAGLFDAHGRSRELVYVLVANRAARGLAGLKVHSGELGVEQAMRFAHEHTPFGWLKLDGETNWGEQQLYLEQPGYGTSYLTGKAMIEKLLGERARQLGERFTLRQFFDEFHAAGMMPVSMIRWELTGLDDEVRRLDAASGGGGR